MLIFRKWFARWYFNRAVEKANIAWELTGIRHFVVPDDNMNLKVVTRDYIKDYNKTAKKKGKKRINGIVELLEMSVYVTPVGNFEKRQKIIVK